eukprot:6086015-Amphidinium_carterae.1
MSTVCGSSLRQQHLRTNKSKGHNSGKFGKRMNEAFHNDTCFLCPTSAIAVAIRHEVRDRAEKCLME